MAGKAEKENNTADVSNELQEDPFYVGPRKAYHRNGKDVEASDQFEMTKPGAQMGKVSTPYPW